MKSREKAMRIYFICNGFYQILSTNSVTILYILYILYRICLKNLFVDIGTKKLRGLLHCQSK